MELGSVTDGTIVARRLKCGHPPPDVRSPAGSIVLIRRGLPFYADY